MLKAINTGGSITANSTIPLTLKFNTNNKLALNNNQITVNKAGFYDITGTFVITSTGTSDITIQLYANGVAIPEAKATITPASSTNYTVTIEDLEQVKWNFPNLDKVKLEWKSTTAFTLVSANVGIYEVR